MSAIAVTKACAATTYTKGFGAIGDAIWDDAWAATRVATWHATRSATRDAVRDAVGFAAIAATTSGGIWTATRDAIDKDLS